MHSRAGRRRSVAFAMSVAGLAIGVAMVVAGGRGGGVGAQAQLPVIEGEAWIMSGTAYNTQQPVLHHVALPPGGADETTLNYNFNFSNQLMLFASSSRVSCTGAGQTPGAQSVFALCKVELQGFELWVGPYKIIKADSVTVTSSTSAGGGQAPVSFASANVQGLCVYIEQEYANNSCQVPTPGNPVTINRPPIHGTVSLGATTNFTYSLGAESSATAFVVDLENDLYPTSTGIRSVEIAIGYAKSRVELPPPTPTPTRTPTPTKTPTPPGTPEVFKAALPGVSRDQE